MHEKATKMVYKCVGKLQVQGKFPNFCCESKDCEINVLKLVMHYQYGMLFYVPRFELMPSTLFLMNCKHALSNYGTTNLHLYYNSAGHLILEVLELVLLFTHSVYRPHLQY